MNTTTTAATFELAVEIPAGAYAQLTKDDRAWARFCWETYGRYLGANTEAKVTITVKDTGRWLTKL